MALILAIPPGMLSYFLFTMLATKGEVSETSTWSSHDINSYLTGQGPTVEFTPMDSYISPHYTYGYQGDDHRVGPVDH